jgi:hypothetical protein
VSPTFTFLTTSGLVTKYILTSQSCYVIVIPGSFYTFTMYTGIYAYNAIIAPSGQRLAKVSGCIFDYGNGYLLEYGTQFLSSFYVYRGDTLLGSYNFTTQDSTNIFSAVVGCVTIEYVFYDSGDYTYTSMVRLTKTPLTDFSGEGELKFQLVSSQSFGGYTPIMQSTQFTVLNY